MSQLLEQANSTPISAELLGEVLEMLGAMPSRERWASESRAARLLQLLERKGLGRDADAIAVAIDFRITALVRLQREDALRGWSMPGGEPGLNVIHAELVKAAATEPLVEDAAGDARFEAESFRLRILAGVEPHGQA